MVVRIKRLYQAISPGLRRRKTVHGALILFTSGPGQGRSWSESGRGHGRSGLGRLRSRAGKTRRTRGRVDPASRRKYDGPERGALNFSEVFDFSVHPAFLEPVTGF